MAIVQFATPDMPDNDGFYHIKLAYLMRTEGIKPDFSWLPLSILNAREFYDHHFLFHVFLIPFTFGDLHLGAKWAVVFFAIVSFLAVWYLFQRQRAAVRQELYIQAERLLCETEAAVIPLYHTR